MGKGGCLPHLYFFLLVISAVNSKPVSLIEMTIFDEYSAVYTQTSRNFLEMSCRGVVLPAEKTSETQMKTRNSPHFLKTFVPR